MINTERHSKVYRTPDRGVSPVIGVVLMVAITIILAAIIGAFVIQFSPTDDEVSPIATITIEPTDGNLTLHHQGGDELSLDEFTLLVDGDAENGNTSMTGQFRSAQQETVIIESPDGEIDVALRHDPSGELLVQDSINLQ